MRKRFTDEQWSRILSAHAGGQLIRGGREWSEDVPPGASKACILQAAYQLPRPPDSGDPLVDAFDVKYWHHWTAKELIAFVDGVKR